MAQVAPGHLIANLRKVIPAALKVVMKFRVARVVSQIRAIRIGRMSRVITAAVLAPPAHLRVLAAAPQVVVVLVAVNPVAVHPAALMVVKALMVVNPVAALQVDL